MIRLSILFLSIFSLIYGIYFLIFPYSFVNLTVAENTNIAWLRNLGGAITGLLFIGLLMIYLNTCLLYTSPSPRDTEVSRMPSSA